MTAQNSLPPLLIIAGPTASGKSGLALDAAEQFGGVVINADSMQVYRELRIITARPSETDEARVPHRLYGVLPAAERCSAGRWRELAMTELDRAWAGNQLPVLVGGTGLYIKALLEGLSDIPDIPGEMREQAQSLFQELGPEAFHGRLFEVDPQSAERLPPTDTQRLIRAYEVFLATGAPLSHWHDAPPANPPLAAAVQLIVLEPPRDALYAACNGRFELMIKAGALEEVRGLMTEDLDPSLPAMKALGVPPLIAHLRDEMTLEAAVDAAKQATRNFAKRQMTWFRNQIGKSDRVFEQYSESLSDKILSNIRF